MKNLKLLKLKSSEEVLAELLLEGGEHEIATKNPVVIIVVPPRNPSEKQQLAFVPYVQFTPDEQVNIQREHVAAICEPIKELVENYNRMFSSLTLPQKQLILP